VVCLATSEGKKTSRWRPVVVLLPRRSSLSEVAVWGTPRRDNSSPAVLVCDLDAVASRVDGHSGEAEQAVALPRRGRMMSDSDASELSFRQARDGRCFALPQPLTVMVGTCKQRCEAKYT